MVERSEGSAAAKQRLRVLLEVLSGGGPRPGRRAETPWRLRVLLEVLSGGCRLKEACERLGLKQARLGQLRRRALHGALGALEPRPGGRPRRRRGGTSEQVAALAARVRELEVPVHGSRVTAVQM